MQLFNRYPAAVAKLSGGDAMPCLCGTVRFYPMHGNVLIETDVAGLPDTESGFFAMHIHEGSNCLGEGFPQAGNHYNPKRLPHPRHPGDLPPLLSCDGRAYQIVMTDRFCLSEIVGRTVILHSDPDDFRSQPSGNAGVKIACGKICPGM